MTTETEGAIDSTVAVGVEVERFENGKPLPAPGADEQKPKADAVDIPATGADDKKPEPAEQETAEEQQKRELSRRARARDRELKARVRAETERDQARAELAKLEAERTAKQEPAEPKRENFESYEAYLEARADFRADQKIAEALKKDREERQPDRSQQQPTEAVRKQGENWVKQETAFRALAEDYDATVTPKAVQRLGLSDEARRAIVESDAGPQLLHHLIKNPSEAWRISDLDDAEQAEAIEELQEKLPKPGKKASNAPPPATPPKGGSPVEGFREEMTQKEYEAQRKKQGSPFAGLH